MPKTPEEKRAYNREYYRKNREREKARTAKWRAENPDKYNAQNKRQTERYRTDPEYRAQKAKWQKESDARCKDRLQAYEKMRGKRDREKLREYQRQYRAEHREELNAYERERSKADRLENPGKYRAKDAQRRKAARQATPPWANLKRIEKIYMLAAWASKYTAEPLEVDHIIPLQHERICGLHVENNLQVIPLSENRSKANQWAA